MTPLTNHGSPLPPSSSGAPNSEASCLCGHAHKRVGDDVAYYCGKIGCGCLKFVASGAPPSPEPQDNMVRFVGGPYDGHSAPLDGLERTIGDPPQYFMPIDHAESAVYVPDAPTTLRYLHTISDE